MPPTGQITFCIFGQNWPLGSIFCIFIFAALKPKIFVVKSSHQQKSCKAHKVGQFCQKKKIKPLSVLIQKLGTAQ